MSSFSGLSMAQEEDKHSLEAKFAAAVKVIRSLPEEGTFQPSDDMMLMFYSYYKQATIGPCSIPRPTGFWDTRGKAKWDAWSALGNMTKEEAMKNYIENIQLILETVPISEEVSDLVQMLGNFYTEVGGEEAEENEVDRRPFTRPFAQHADWSPDPQLLMVEDKRWRSDTKGSCSSVEPSMSSFTNGTHSSLNSDMEEEELACSIEPSVQCNPYMHINGHLSDHSETVPEKNRRSTDSDNEEFCDSMEHLAVEEQLSTSKGLSPGLGAASGRQRDLWFESNTTLIDGEDQILTGDFKEGLSPGKHNSSLSRTGRGSQTPRATCSSELCVRVDAACCGMSTCSLRPVSVTRGNINEQIATALLRLQHDMANVLHRLHALEELTKSQSRSSLSRREDSVTAVRQFLRPSWWPCDFSPLTVVFTALWPLITHWLVQLYLQRKRSKIP
ncbi:acyl-CoA-binding domain-containing protein 5-B-like isoform X3 [Archocentrus centrarchus]|uniref:acyl-CoA-binding domain-containing protein 5-B-like isoform X3 n=1 Tax=Archocentrus centrarchus TaxID=63155 RepID=UPI0011E9F48F|nr:acyl-CoA-binding domain-containing protein 5-B-like isoform X3 [Archocentrus centrarchus]